MICEKCAAREATTIVSKKGREFNVCVFCAIELIKEGFTNRPMKQTKSRKYDTEH